MDPLKSRSPNSSPKRSPKPMRGLVRRNSFTSSRDVVKDDRISKSPSKKREDKKRRSPKGLKRRNSFGSNRDLLKGDHDDDSDYSDDGDGRDFMKSLQSPSYRNMKGSALFDTLWSDSPGLSKAKPKVEPIVEENGSADNSVQLSIRVIELRDENTRLLAELGRVEDRITELQDEREIEKSRFTKNVEELMELKNANLAAKTEIEVMEEELDAVRQDLEEKVEEFEAMQASSQEQAQKIDELSKHLEYAEQDIVRLKSGALGTPAPDGDGAASFGDDDMKRKLEKKNSDIESLHATTSEQQDKIAQLEQLLIEKENTIKRHRAEGVVHTKRTQELESEIALLRDEVPSESTKSKLEDLEAWERTLSEKEVQFEKEQKEHQAKYSRLQDLDAYDKELEEKAQKYASELDFITMKEKRLDEWERDMVIQEKELKEAESLIKEGGMGSTAAASGDSDDKDAIIGVLRKEVARLKENGSKEVVKDLERQHEEAVKKLQESVNTQIKQLVEEKHELERELEEEQMMNDEKLREKDDAIDFIQREMAFLKDELEALLLEEQDREAQEGQIDAIMEENELLQDQLDELRDETQNQIDELEDQVEKLTVANNELKDKVEEEAVKNKDMIILDLENEVEELSAALEKDKKNDVVVKLRGEVKDLKRQIKELDKELANQDKESVRAMKENEEIVTFMYKEIQRLRNELGLDGDFEIPGLTTDDPLDEEQAQKSGFFSKLIG